MRGHRFNAHVQHIQLHGMDIGGGSFLSSSAATNHPVEANSKMSFEGKPGRDHGPFSTDGRVELTAGFNSTAAH